MCKYTELKNIFLVADMYLQAEIYKFMEINRTIWYDSIEFLYVKKGTR